ncbi:unnamed protein product [Phyllotreta striolata]|uniref:Heparanase n=1 Tax=Phyllotreta striolata TaxID=444603 RepID=A0A9N9XSF5_PHYSR|nr:unnamed protein product [Phyllotreta striolata]
MSRRKLCCLLIFCYLQVAHTADENSEISCNINVKKAAQRVSEKFLSISVDPAVLLAGVNLSENSLRLAKHLYPSYIRIAGPSTRFVKYVDQDDKSLNFLSDGGDAMKITPSVWFGVNEWFKLAKLTPIFAINDAETARGLVWNPKATLPLFELAEKLNNETRYKQDINILHYVLTAYGTSNDTWKIIGSDLSSLPVDRVENVLMDESEILEAAMWEPEQAPESFPGKDAAYKILSRPSARPRTKVWTTAPKSLGPVTFESALLWAKQVGNAAKAGYEVIFRQPRIYELFIDTPVYWFSLLHKQLMGCNVLEAKSSLFQGDIDVFAHCTRKQNSFVRRGAMTVMIVNDRPVKYKVKVKLGNNFSDKSMEIQTYLLTSDRTNSTDVYLNGQLLSSQILQEKNPFPPKIRRTKTSSHILLALPPSSIGFFVLPGARVPVCIEQENETQLLLEEIEENQKSGLSGEIALQLGSRSSFNGNNALLEITRKLKQEFESDEKLYSKAGEKAATEQHVELDAKLDDKKDGRKTYLDRVKFADKHKKFLDFQRRNDALKKLFLDKSKPVQKPKSMDLTSEEMEKILKDRAKERAAKKHIVFTDEELEALIRKTSKNFNKRAINQDLLEKYSRKNGDEFEDDWYTLNQQGPELQIRGKREVQNIEKRVRSPRGINFNLLDLKSKIAEHKRFWDDKKEELLGNSNSIKQNIQEKIKELKSKYRFKRDINANALKKKSKSVSNEEIEATIRKPGQTSDELAEELELNRSHDEEEEKQINKGEVFAELADSEDEEDDDILINDNPKPKKLSLFEKKAKIDPFAVERPTIDIVEPIRRKSKKKKKNKAEDTLQFLTTSEEFLDVEDDVPFIHEFDIKADKMKKTGQAKLHEMNENYDAPSLFKRDLERAKRDTGFTIIEMAVVKDDMEPEEFMREVLSPFFGMSKMEEIYKKINNITANKKPRHRNPNTIPKDQDNSLKTADESFFAINNRSEDNLDATLGVVQSATIKDDIVSNESQNDETDDAITPNKDDYEDTFNSLQSTDKEDDAQLDGIFKDFEQLDNSLAMRRKRDTSEVVGSPKKKNKKKNVPKKQGKKTKKDKKPKENNSFADQMNMLKEKLQERKDEIDKMIKKQKEIEQSTKGKKASKKSKKIAHKRSILDNNEQVIPNLRKWRPSDITLFKKDISFPNRISPPNDYNIFKNIFNRNRRSLEMDSNENDIQRTNEISKTDDINDINLVLIPDSAIKGSKKLKSIIQEYKDESYSSTPSEENGTTVIPEENSTTATPADGSSTGKITLEDGDYKFKLANEDEFDIIKSGIGTEIKFVRHEHSTEAISPKQRENDGDVEGTTFVPKILPRALQPFEDIEKFLEKVKDVFEKAGEDIKYYFNNIGIKI